MILLRPEHQFNTIIHGNSYTFYNFLFTIQRPNFSNYKTMNINIRLTLIPKTHNLQLLSNPISEKHT